MSGICDICKRSECVERQDGAWNCDKYLSYASNDTCHESNYEKLFGTPERAARTLIQTSIACQDMYRRCTECPFYGTSICPNNFDGGDYDALLEWLKEDG